VTGEVARYRQPEPNRWTKSSPVFAVDLSGVDESQHANTWKDRRGGRIPMLHRQVGDVVFARKADRKIAEPSLHPSDRLGEQMVVDETDAHRYAWVACSAGRSSATTAV
jgi:hypothetical protein